MSPPKQQPPRFFLDRSLGRKAVPEGLRMDGWDIVTLAEHYGVPADEQVAVGLTLFYWKWENHDGLPAQIVMHAARKALLQSADQASIAAEEF